MTNISNRKSSVSIAAIASSFCLFSLAAYIPEQFWKTIEIISESSSKGLKSMADSWPNKGLVTYIENNQDFKKYINLGPFEIANGIQAKSTEIRVSESGDIRLVILRIDGICINSSTVKQRFPSSKVDDFPQPNNPDPVSYRFIELKGVEVSFGFRGAMPGCLSHVVFEPK